jgi:hypothetical protein
MKTLSRFLPGVFLLTVWMSAHGQTSNPLTNWQLVANQTVSLRGLAYQDGRFVGVGASSNIVVSSDGASWFLVSNGLTNNWDYLLGVSQGAGQFVAVGGSTGPILSSPDGLHWTRRHTLRNGEFWAVTYGGGRFVAVGYGAPGPAISATSSNGIDWETFVLPLNTTPRNVAYGNGVFVAAGAPISMVSSNGRDWTAINSVLAQGIAFGEGRFIATLIRSGFTSMDALGWTEFPLPAPGIAEQNYYTAGYANGTFILGGELSGVGLLAAMANGAITLLPSSNQVAGVTTSMGAIRDVIFTDGRFYLADQSGKIWRSARAEPVSQPVFTGVARSGGQTTLSFSAPGGFHYSVECAERPDAPEWLPCINSIFAVTDETRVTDAGAGGEARFYRVHAQ